MTGLDPTPCADNLSALKEALESRDREIVRLNALVREQDAARGTATVHVACEWWNDSLHYIITCPSGDEKKIAALAGTALIAQAVMSIGSLSEFVSDGEASDLITTWMTAAQGVKGATT